MLHAARPLTNPLLLFQALISHANAIGLLDRIKEAVSLYEEALEVAGNRLQNPHYEAMAKSSLAGALIDLGQTRRGERLYRQARTALHALGDQSAEAGCWTGLDLFHFMKGDFHAAIRHFGKAVKLFGNVNEGKKRSTQIHLADAYARINAPEAEVIYRAVLEKCLLNNDLQRAAECHVRLMARAGRRKEITVCRAHFEAAADIFSRQDQPDGQGFAVLAWANVLNQNDRRTEAIEAYQKAAQLFERSQNDRLQAYALNNVAMPLMLENRSDEAKTMLAEAFPQGEAIVQELLAAEERAGEDREALADMGMVSSSIAIILIISVIFLQMNADDARRKVADKETRPDGTVIERKLFSITDVLEKTKQLVPKELWGQIADLTTSGGLLDGDGHIAGPGIEIVALCRLFRGTRRKRLHFQPAIDPIIFDFFDFLTGALLMIRTCSFPLLSRLSKSAQ